MTNIKISDAAHRLLDYLAGIAEQGNIPLPSEDDALSAVQTALNTAAAEGGRLALDEAAKLMDDHQYGYDGCGNADAIRALAYNLSQYNDIPATKP